MLMGPVTEYKTFPEVLGRGTQNLQLCIYFEETNNIIKEKKWYSQCIIAHAQDDFGPLDIIISDRNDLANVLIVLYL